MITHRRPLTAARAAFSRVAEDLRRVGERTHFGANSPAQLSAVLLKACDWCAVMPAPIILTADASTQTYRARLCSDCFRLLRCHAGAIKDGRKEASR